MSTLKVDTILKRTGTGTITLGQSGDTVDIPSGATLDVTGATVTGLTDNGKILQVQTSPISDLGQVSVSGSSWTALTTMTVSLTPAATTSTLLVLGNSHYDSGGSTNQLGLNIYMDINGAGYNAVNTYITSTPYTTKDSQRTGFWSYQIVASPSTTSACNFRLYGYSDGTGYIDMKSATLTVMEIGA